MAPSVLGSSTLAKDSTEPTKQVQKTIFPSTPAKPKPTTDKNYKWKFVWTNTLGFIYLHTVALYGMYFFFTTIAWKTFVFLLFMTVFASLGVTAGAHRLWSHRTYKAKLPLRILLAFMQTMSFQNSIYEWCRDHRVHHKYTDTDADPHNATRGFFFSHIGWLMIKKHEEVKERGSKIDLSDLEADPVVRIQRSFFLVLMPLIAFALPWYILTFYFGEDPWIAWYLTIFRYTLQLNMTWCVNSAAHIWGTRPYDKAIGPRENLFVTIIATGEGYHNYHHVFPYDYKAAELHTYTFNLTTAFIDMFSKIGWSYDMKQVTEKMITRRALRTGDGSRKSSEETRTLVEDYLRNMSYESEDMVWGWGDEDMKSDDKADIKRFNNIKSAAFLG